MKSSFAFFCSLALLFCALWSQPSGALAESLVASDTFSSTPERPLTIGQQFSTGTTTATPPPTQLEYSDGSRNHRWLATSSTRENLVIGGTPEDMWVTPTVEEIQQRFGLFSFDMTEPNLRSIRLDWQADLGVRDGEGGVSFHGGGIAGGGGNLGDAASNGGVLWIQLMSTREWTVFAYGEQIPLASGTLALEDFREGFNDFQFIYDVQREELRVSVNGAVLVEQLDVSGLVVDGQPYIIRDRAGSSSRMGFHFHEIPSDPYDVVRFDNLEFHARRVSPVEEKDFPLWVAENFSAEEAADPGIGGWDADPLGEGISNIVRYALGLPARQPARDLLPFSHFAEGHLALTYTRAKEAVGVDIQVEVSDNLIAWQATPEAVEEIRVIDEGDFELVTVMANNIPASAPRGYMRLRIGYEPDGWETILYEAFSYSSPDRFEGAQVSDLPIEFGSGRWNVATSSVPRLVLAGDETGTWLTDAGSGTSSRGNVFWSGCGRTVITPSMRSGRRTS